MYDNDIDKPNHNTCNGSHSINNDPNNDTNNDTTTTTTNTNNHNKHIMFDAGCGHGSGCERQENLQSIVCH